LWLLAWDQEGWFGLSTSHVNQPYVAKLLWKGVVTEILIAVLRVGQDDLGTVFWGLKYIVLIQEWSYKHILSYQSFITN